MQAPRSVTETPPVPQVKPNILVLSLQKDDWIDGLYAPLYNALKYASSFPVIYLSAAQRIVVSDMMALKGEDAARETWHGEHQLFRLWCALYISSMLSHRLYARSAGFSPQRSTLYTHSGGT